MLNETNDNVCAHEGCTCPATNDSNYCSPSCEAAANTGTTTISCECGHSGCKAEINS